MQKRTREILALVLLGVFALIGVGVMGYYILVGHNWNVTASNIDDSIGQMDGYTVILYEGTRKPQEVEASGDTSNGSTSTSSHEAERVDMSSVAASYREKNATVYTVDVKNLSRYSEPFIVGKSGRRVGFLAATKSTLRSEIRKDVAFLVDEGAEYTVALTDDPALCSAAGEGLAGGMSVIICEDPKGKVPNGEYRGSTYCVSAPEIGQVGIVVISPSGVFSTKVVDDLAES